MCIVWIEIEGYGVEWVIILVIFFGVKGGDFREVWNREFIGVGC